MNLWPVVTCLMWHANNVPGTKKFISNIQVTLPGWFPLFVTNLCPDQNWLQAEVFNTSWFCPIWSFQSRALKLKLPLENGKAEWCLCHHHSGFDIVCSINVYDCQETGWRAAPSGSPTGYSCRCFLWPWSIFVFWRMPQPGDAANFWQGKGNTCFLYPDEPKRHEVALSQYLVTFYFCYNWWCRFFFACGLRSSAIGQRPRNYLSCCCPCWLISSLKGI